MFFPPCAGQLVTSALLIGSDRDEQSALSLQPWGQEADTHPTDSAPSWFQGPLTGLRQGEGPLSLWWNYSKELFTGSKGNGTPLQYSCLENPMDGGAWWAVVHGVSSSRTWLSNFTLTFHFHAFEKEMATHSSVLAWRIPGMGEPGGLPSMGSHRVGHDWSDLAAAVAMNYLKGLKNYLII